MRSPSEVWAERHKTRRKKNIPTGTAGGSAAPRGHAQKKLPIVLQATSVPSARGHDFGESDQMKEQ